MISYPEDSTLSFTHLLGPDPAPHTSAELGARHLHARLTQGAFLFVTPWLLDVHSLGSKHLNFEGGWGGCQRSLTNSK